MFVTYPAIFYKEDNNKYSVFFVGFGGGATCGDNIEDAYRMAIDWLGINLMDFYLEGKELPKPLELKEINILDHLDFLDTEEEKQEVLKNSFLTLVGFDLVEYIKSTQKTTVRKNVTIPSWLNEMGKNYNLNFSNLLQEAIKKELDIE